MLHTKIVILGRDGILNADDAASAVAGTLGARRLVLLTDVPGILDERGRVVERISTERAEALIAQGVIHGGMIPKVRAACRAALRAGVPAIIASWNEPDRLGALARGASLGTIIDAAPSGRPAQEHTPA